MALRKTGKAFTTGLRRLACSSQHGCLGKSPHALLSTTPTTKESTKQKLTQMEISPSVLEGEANLQKALFEPDLVIFDKDGTLICPHTMWNHWCEDFAERVTTLSDKDLHKSVYQLIGYDSDSRKIKLGILAEKSHPYIRGKVVDMLGEEGLSISNARAIIDQTYEDQPSNMESCTKQISDMKTLFGRLKAQNIKVAICTADSRDNTEMFLSQFELESLVDLVVCGDDEISKPKPNIHNAVYICKKLGVDPADTIMVGDTPADTIMGQAANLGLTIGVLTGVGTKDSLTHADIIVDSVDDVVDLITSKEKSSRINDLHSLHMTARGLGKIAEKNSLLRPKPRMAGHVRNFNSSATLSKSGYEEAYDKVIVGAGSAGCVLANRLTEDEGTSVLLLEAGPKDTILGSKMLQFKIHMPAALTYNLCDDKYNWYYHTVPQTHVNDRVMYWPRGRVWGGSSSLNAMAYVRGHAEDYNRWEREGAKGWSYADCLPYFKKAQAHELGEDDYRGGDGPLHVSRGTSGSILHEAWIKAGQEAGYPFTDDMNGYQQEGIGYMDATIHKGQRWSTASAYLRPALSRPNLNTLTGVLVTRVLFEGKKAVGVEVVKKGKVTKIRAEELILCGGAINSPQLLMLSGVGPKEHLKEVGIDVLHDLPGVGANLQDHLELYVAQNCSQPITLYSEQKGLRMIMVGLQWFYNQTGAASSAHLESGGFVRSHAGVSHPDIQFHFLPSQVIDHGRKPPYLEAYQVHVGPMRPTSVGWLKLASKSPKDAPILNPKYLSTEQDRWEMRQCIKLTREIFAQPAFDGLRGPELAPGSDVESDAALDKFVRAAADSAYHPSCTCKMGKEDDHMAVVGPDANIFGLENIRVIDASIMPSVASGNLNAPTIMIAEKAADIVRNKTPLTPATQVPVYQPDLTKQR